MSLYDDWVAEKSQATAPKSLYDQWQEEKASPPTPTSGMSQMPPSEKTWTNSLPTKQPADATRVPLRQDRSFFSESTMGQSNWLPDKYLLKEGKQGGSALPNYDSPYWKLSKKDQLTIQNLSTAMMNQDEWAKMVKTRYGFDPHDPKQAPFTSYGKAAGAFESGMAGLTGKETQPVEGSSPILNTAGNLLGTGVRYGALMAPLTAAGVPELPALVGASMASAAQRQAISPNPSQNAATEEIVSSLLLGAGMKGVGKLAKALKTPTPPGAEFNYDPTTRTLSTGPEVPKPVVEVPQSPMIGATEPRTMYDQWQTEKATEPTPQVEAQATAPAKTLPEVTLDKPVRLVAEDNGRPVFGSDETPPPLKVEANDVAGREQLAQNATPEPEQLTLTKAEIKDLRSNMKLSDLPTPKRKSFLRSADNAKRKGLVDNAMDIAEDVLANKRVVTDEEHAAFVMRATQLSNEIDYLVAAKAKMIDDGMTDGVNAIDARINSRQADFDRLTQAADLSGTEAGRALSIRRIGVNKEDYSVAKLKQQATAKKGSRLTPDENANIERNALEYKKAQEELEAMRKETARLREENDQKIADRILRRNADVERIGAQTATRKAAITAERLELKKRIAAIGYRVNDITGATAEGSYLIGRLALTYLKEGIVTLSDVVERVKRDIPDLTDKDVWRAINATDPDHVKKIRTAIDENITNVKREARLLDEIDDAQNGIFDKPKSGRERVEPTERIKDLQKKLRELRKQFYQSSYTDSDRLARAVQTVNELQDQLSGMYRNLKSKNSGDMTPEMEQIAEKIKVLRKTMNVEDTLANLNEQLRTGQYEVPKKIQTVEVPKEVQEKQIAVNIARKKIQKILRDMEPPTRTQKVNEAFSFLRTLKATADMSYALRQGLVLSVRRPALAAEAFGKAFQAMFSKYKFEEIDNAIRSHHNQFLRDKAGLYLAPTDDATMSLHEEYFMSRLLNKIPDKANVFAASERNMVTGLNVIRAGVFDEFLSRFPNATPEELAAWADFINKATGRGDLLHLGKAGGVNFSPMIFFAPRFAASRFQTPATLFKYFSMPRVRGEIAKDMASVMTMAGVTLSLASLAGAEVSANPLDSDFGKIKIGDTRVDIFAGFQQPARLIAMLGYGVYDAPVNGWKQVQKDFSGSTPLDIFGRFSAYKLSPAVTVPNELISGKNIMGQKVHLSDVAIDAVMPLVLGDIIDAYKKDNLVGSVAAGAGSFIGLGISTYHKQGVK